MLQKYLLLSILNARWAPSPGSSSPGSLSDDVAPRDARASLWFFLMHGNDAWFSLRAMSDLSERQHCFRLASTANPYNHLRNQGAGRF